jgi:hypothetical protein
MVEIKDLHHRTIKAIQRHNIDINEVLKMTPQELKRRISNLNDKEYYERNKALILSKARIKKPKSPGETRGRQYYDHINRELTPLQALKLECYQLRHMVL